MSGAPNEPYQPSFFTDAEGCFALEGVCLQSLPLLASLIESSLFFAVFSVADDSDPGEFVVLV